MTFNQLRVVTPFREYHNFPAEPYAVTGLRTVTRLTHMHLLRENNRTACIQRPTTRMSPYSRQYTRFPTFPQLVFAI